MNANFGAAEFRRTLGHYPTGVCVVTSIADGAPVAMVVGSFTSVSLDPPLVAFLPARTSKSWARMSACGRFCINVLAKHQRTICTHLASRAENKFNGLPYRKSPAGQPIIDGIVAWIDCELHNVIEAGDHFIVVGRALALAVEHEHRPLIFFQGGYGEFAPLAEEAQSSRVG
ncbi:flavin reductase [Bradyrhizobium brasilense]|uniref:flavin reductase family protein n=1 Tax=Bradyrhizobium brasilense TaxID=1419277 RepID=UPI001456A474|nr:flavin reductase family protein [Bradyrhizobium brasilense]NLS68204.1 flavin reductase [Bradyrhizobium brasilense]